MKSTKIRNDLWRITAPDGRHADLLLVRDWWRIMIDGQPQDGAYSRRFDAKVEAEQLLAK